MHVNKASAACVLLFIGLSSTIPLEKRDPPGPEFCDSGQNSPKELEAKRKMGVAPPTCNYAQLNRLGLDIPGNIKDQHDREYKDRKIAEDSTWDLEHPEMDPEAQDAGADDFPPNDPFDGWLPGVEANPTKVIDKRAAEPMATGSAAKRIGTKVVKVVQDMTAADAKKKFEEYKADAGEYKDMVGDNLEAYKKEAEEYKDVMAKWSAQQWYEMGLKSAQKTAQQLQGKVEHN